ncbi:MAG: filamentous hemagglutinin N-terminal domain-containing protein, partial [Rhodocyclaceae bacterium]|nr:filamentous hemagglutinin N-terminal domain-containing protein [Rhodocyclaceae bacterium]
MNKTHRLIWNIARNAWIVTHEAAATHGKPSSPKRHLVSVLAGALIAQAAVAAAPAPNTLPTGGQVAAGQAVISQAGNAMIVRQGSDKAILNWQSFNIGSQASVNFQQPSSNAVALNRVLGADPSAIYGQLKANGQVFLINPNGVLFGQGAKVDVGGMVASTLNITNADFLNGNYRFTGNGSEGGVANAGELYGRYIALLAPEVRNEGIVAARLGTSVLAAGGAVTLDIAGGQLLKVQVDKATFDTLVENKRLVQADGGTVILSAQSASDLLGRVVNTGAIEAKGISADGGTVRLLASSNVEHSGSINADAASTGKGGSVTLLASLDNPNSRTDVNSRISAKGGSDAGDGGFIETSATHLKIADTASIDTSATHGNNGQWLLDPYDFTIAASNGDITGATLAAALGSNNVTIQTADSAVSCTNANCGTGTSAGNGDIFVNDSVTWSSNKTLTLSAWRNIAINAPVNVNGAGGSLVLAFAQSDVEANFPAGTYTVNAPVGLVSGASFSTKAASDGTPINYTVINDATALANMASGLAGNYVLGNDVAAPGTSWSPVGNTATPFTGIFDGLGHKVTGLTHTNAGADVDVGLFGGSTGLIQNVGVTGVSIEGSQNVGALVGYNNGFVVNSYATGTVQGTGAGNVGRIGGLVGFSAGPIQSSYANVTVTATSGDQTSGDPLSTGNGGIGGLAGVVSTSVSDSYSRGSVTGDNAVGGLVGFSAAAISNSYSTGAVAGNTNVGGFVGLIPYGGFMMPFIFGSFWNTDANPALSGGGDGADFLTGLTAAQMQTPSNYTGAGWDTAAWDLRSGQYPLLKGMLQPIFVYTNSTSTTYSGTAVSGFGTTVSGGTVSDYSGTITVTPSTASPTNAGTYTLTPSGLTLTAVSDQNGFRIEYVDGTLTINKAHLTVTADNQTRLYGQANPTFSETISGFVNGE